MYAIITQIDDAGPIIEAIRSTEEAAVTRMQEAIKEARSAKYRITRHYTGPCLPTAHLRKRKSVWRLSIQFVTDTK